MDAPGSYLDLYDFRLRVFTMYRERNEAAAGPHDATEVWQRFRSARDELFKRHPQSALDEQERARFERLAYFPYNANACVEAILDTNVEPQRLDVQTSGEDAMPMSRAGRLHFSFGGEDCALSLYWIDVYGGGLFLPFRDLTAPRETYGSGRYLVDTVKGSDFPRMWQQDGAWRAVLDFNYAYNPSCAYDPHWACPLAPLENRLTVAIRAGERAFAGAPGRP